MAKWKCNNTACLHTWSEKEPTCCPQCGSTDFEPVEGGPDWSKIAKIGGGILVLIIISLLMRGCPTEDVTATITFKESAGAIKVELDIDNKDKKDFNIELQKGGSVNEIAKGLKTKTFTGLMPGTYYVNVRYVGTKTGEDIPKITYDKTKGPYIINTIVVPPEPPTIVSVVPVANKTTLKYTLTIKVKPDSLSALCEYSIDGQNFYTSNVFNNVSDGTYSAIQARLIADNSMNDNYLPLILPKISTESPPPVNVQALLNRISDGSTNAFDELANLLPTETILVTGAGGNIRTLFDLMVDCNSGNRYTVDPRVINKTTTTINARK